MKKDKLKIESDEKEEDAAPSSPVCYANADDLRAGFAEEGQTKTESMENVPTYILPKTPEEIPVIFAQAWMNRDAKYLSSLFDAAADFVNVVGLWWHKRSEIEKAHDYGLKVIFQNSELSVLRTKVRYLTNEIATVHAEMKLTGQTALDSNSKAGNSRHTIFLFVAQYNGEFWNCVSAQNTEIIPGSETFFADSRGDLRQVNYRKKK